MSKRGELKTRTDNRRKAVSVRKATTRGGPHKGGGIGHRDEVRHSGKISKRS